ncbi:MAG TPA: hypothetical protein PLO50_06135 [Nitrospira sp.]|nr:hypothetical protein [Nitrospira sp.]
MAKIVEVQIVHPCPLAGSHPGMLERIPVFPVMEEAPTDSWSFSEQRLVSQTVKGNHFGHPFDFCLAWRGNHPPAVSPLHQPLFMDLDQLVLPKTDLQRGHRKPPYVR